MNGFINIILDAALLFPQNGVLKKIWGSYEKIQRFGGDPGYSNSCRYSSSHYNWVPLYIQKTE